MSSFKVNISKAERIATIIVGAYLLYKALKQKDYSLKTAGSALVLARGVSGYCPAYDLMGKKEVQTHNVNVQTTIVINRPVAEVYAFWRKLENLPLIMTHLEIVEEISRTKSHWTAKIPGGIGRVSWDALIVNEKINEVIGWKSVEKSTIDNAGKVEFTAIGSQSTQLHIVFSYRPAMGPVAENVARFFSPAFEKVIESDVNNFKEYMEAGFTASMPSDFRNSMI